MRTKKILFALLALGVMSASAFAEPTIESIVDKQVTVSCDATTGKNVALTVVRKDHTVSQTEWIVAVKEAVAEDGEAVFQFNMPDTLNNTSIDGEYMVYTKIEGNQKEKTDLLYVAPATRTGIKGALQSVTTKDELAAIFNNPDNDLGLKFFDYDMDSYNALPTPMPGTDYKAATMQTMFDEVGDFSIATDAVMTENFEKALVLNYVNSSTSSDGCKTVIGNLTFENVAYKDIEDSELKNWISLCMYNHKPYADYPSILTEYETSNILYKFKQARFSDIKNLFGTYADDLGITSNPAYNAIYNKYISMSDDGPTNEAIADRITVDDDNKLQTVAQLMAEIDAVVNPTVITPPPASGGATTGNYGGGDGGSSGGGGMVLPVVDRNPIAETTGFIDVASNFWGKEAISTLVQNKIIAGDGNGNFRPNDTVTREEFVKMIVSIVGNIDESASCDFADVKKDDWCYKYIANAVNKGIIYGIDATNFGKGNGLTRQDMAVICVRIAESKLTAAREDVAFADESNIADYAKDAVHKLYQAGIVSGTDNNQFSPTAYATRAQAAQILYKAFYN